MSRPLLTIGFGARRPTPIKLVKNESQNNEFKKKKDEIERVLDFIRITESKARSYFGDEATASYSYLQEDEMYRVAFSNPKLTKKELYQKLRLFKEEYWYEQAEEQDFFDDVYLMVE
ncbi:hypothetical protein [Carnobacterium maltaromaticum]|uniref:hypothetical protein n=1 Tax=Carnobacterium maltaromaticum TaxID=2751 RepID=UPI0039B121B6